MSARSKKDRKQQKRRKRKQREMARHEKNRLASARDSKVAEKTWLDNPEVPFPRPPRGVDELATLLGESDMEPEQTPGDATEAELWWGKYSQADSSARLQMTREKLGAVSPDDEAYKDFFPEAIYELESKLAPKDYVAFLEELYASHPDAFALNADWNGRSMVFEYLAQERLDDVDRSVIRLSEGLTEIGEPFFSLMSTIRLAGRMEASQALIDSAVKLLDSSSLMYWAVDKIIEWAMFAHYRQCAAAGATEEAIEVLHDAARQLGLEDSQEYQLNRRVCVLHLAGSSGTQWTRSELITENQDAFRNIYLMGVDYQRWLCKTRDFVPIVADEFRRLVGEAIDGLDCPYASLLAGLPRRKFDRYLAGKLDFMSLDRMHAPATIIAMQHYYDFLKELELVRPGDWQKSQSVCSALWRELQHAVGDEWRTFRFLEKYMDS